MADNETVAEPVEDPRARLAAWLADPASIDAQRAAAAAVEAFPGDPLAAAASLRRAHPALGSSRAAAALEQVELRRLAPHRYGLDASRLLLTRDGLEQATRPEVAEHRSHVLRDAGAHRIVDLTGGLGFDAGAFAAAGLEVTAVERDPVTAVFLAHNCPGVRVVVADAMEPDVLLDVLSALSRTDVVFVDPARRDPHASRGSNLRARPERDPARWSPPWPSIESLAHPRIAAKVTPSFHAPLNWHAEWTSIHRIVVECAVYSWPVFTAKRRATIWADGRPIVVDADDTASATRPFRVGAWLHEPDPAIIRASALSGLLREHPALGIVDPSSTWLTSDAELVSETVRSFAVVEQLEGSATSQRRQLDRIGVTSLAVKCRDVDTDPRSVLRDLDRREGPAHVIVMTRVAGRTVRYLCEPARQRSV